MSKFTAPPERLLRSAISHTTDIRKSPLTTVQTASASTYKAAFCAELSKPLVIKNIYDSRPLGKNEVHYHINA